MGSVQRAGHPGGDEHGDGRDTIAVLAKAFELLDGLAARQEPTLTGLSDATGQSRPTTLRIRSILVARDHVARDRDGRYRLGVRLLQLAHQAAAGIDPRTLTHPVLDSSALGNASLSRYPELMVASVGGPEPFPRRTGRTHPTPAALAAEPCIVRERGDAVDDEENEPGARCLAAPVINQHGARVGGNFTSAQLLGRQCRLRVSVSKGRRHMRRSPARAVASTGIVNINILP